MNAPAPVPERRAPHPKGTPAESPDTLTPDTLTPDTLHPEVRAAVEAATPARLFLSGSPLGYPTRAWLSLRADHAAARDAVSSRLDLTAPLLADVVARHHAVEVRTSVTAEAYLARPDLGRILSADSRRLLIDEAVGVGPAGPDDAPAPASVGLALGDGLSATAAAAHGPAMIDALVAGAAARGWRTTRPVVIHQCRVGVLNELGPLLGCDVVILLIGERPGLAVADSLSAYLAFRPRPGHSDADRNLVSGIYARGTPPAEAATRVLELTARLLAAGTSGVTVKEVIGVPGVDPEAVSRGRRPGPNAGTPAALPGA